jgi:hypothetical protein
MPTERPRLRHSHDAEFERVERDEALFPSVEELREVLSLAREVEARRRADRSNFRLAPHPRSL